MTKIEPTIQTETVIFKNNCINLTEYTNDSDEDILTHVQIRIEGNTVLIFVSDFDRELHHVKMSYERFKKEMLKMLKNYVEKS